MSEVVHHTTSPLYTHARACSLGATALLLASDEQGSTSEVTVAARERADAGGVTADPDAVTAGAAPPRTYFVRLPGAPVVEAAFCAALEARGWARTVVAPEDGDGGGDGDADAGSGSPRATHVALAPASAFTWPPDGAPLPGGAGGPGPAAAAAAPPALVSTGTGGCRALPVAAPGVYPLRTALVRKDGLHATLEALAALAREPAAGGAEPAAAAAAAGRLAACALPGAVVDCSGRGGASVLAQARAALAGPLARAAAVAVKEVATNNGLGVTFVPRARLARELARVAQAAADAAADADDDGADANDIAARAERAGAGGRGESSGRSGLLPHSVATAAGEGGASGDGGGGAPPRPTASRPAPPLRLLAQAYAPRPLLVDGSHKAHVRLNVLALGALAVYAHAPALVHVAGAPLVRRAGSDGARPADAPLDDAAAHVTNAGARGAGGGGWTAPLSRELFARLREAPPREGGGAFVDVDVDVDGGSGWEGAPAGSAPYCAAHDAASVHAAMVDVVGGLFAALMLGRTPPGGAAWAPVGAAAAAVRARARTRARAGGLAPPRGFLPHPAAWELFGLDFLLLATGARGSGGARVVLLEANAGPALGARAAPGTTRPALDGVAALLTAGWPPSRAPPEPEPGSGWTRVY